MKKIIKGKKASPKKTAKKAAKRRFSANDITTLMLRDHLPLKRLIKVLKNPDAEIGKVREAFDEFAPLLVAHAHPEQESLYTYLRAAEETELRVEGFEGYTEHGIADELAEEIKSISDEDDWRAHVKVLGEHVEHHIEDEEEDMIPDMRKDMDAETREEIGRDYLERRAQYDAVGQEEAA